MINSQSSYIWFGYKAMDDPTDMYDWLWLDKSRSWYDGNWRSGQPRGIRHYKDYSREKEYCAATRRSASFKWTALSCSNRQLYLCQTANKNYINMKGEANQNDDITSQMLGIPPKVQCPAKK